MNAIANDLFASDELRHLAEHNHSPRFYRLMGEVMPNWEEVKEKLDGMAESLLNGMIGISAVTR